MMYTRGPLPIGENFIWSGEIPVVAPEAYGIFGGHDAEPDSILDEGVLIYQSTKRISHHYGMRASGDRKYCPALSEYYWYKADLRACRRISSPLRITVHAVASQALSARTKT